MPLNVRLRQLVGAKSVFVYGLSSKSTLDSVRQITVLYQTAREFVSDMSS